MSSRSDVARALAAMGVDRRAHERAVFRTLERLWPLLRQLPATTPGEREALATLARVLEETPRQN
jgi:hypothetical protein